MSEVNTIYLFHYRAQVTRVSEGRTRLILPCINELNFTIFAESIKTS